MAPQIPVKNRHAEVALPHHFPPHHMFMMYEMSMPVLPLIAAFDVRWIDTPCVLLIRLHTAAAFAGINTQPLKGHSEQDIMSTCHNLCLFLLVSTRNERGERCGTLATDTAVQSQSIISFNGKEKERQEPFRGKKKRCQVLFVSYINVVFKVVLAWVWTLDEALR